GGNVRRPDVDAVVQPQRAPLHRTGRHDLVRRSLWPASLHRAPLAAKAAAGAALRHILQRAALRPGAGPPERRAARPPQGADSGGRRGRPEPLEVGPPDSAAHPGTTAASVHFPLHDPRAFGRALTAATQTAESALAICLNT